MMKTQPTVTSGNASKVKVNGYNSHFLHAKRDRKRREADDRQAKYDAMTPVEKYWSVDNC